MSAGVPLPFLWTRRRSRIRKAAAKFAEDTPPTYKSRTEEYETFCNICDKETMHLHYDAGHELDSGGNWKKCRVCGWTFGDHGWRTASRT